MVDRAHRPGARGVLSPDVAKVVVKAVTSRRPKTRYRLGPQSPPRPAGAATDTRPAVGRQHAAHDPVSSAMTAKQGRYYHGDVKAALIDTAIELIAERGVRGFSLAEASRRRWQHPASSRQAEERFL